MSMRMNEVKSSFIRKYRISTNMAVKGTWWCSSKRCKLPKSAELPAAELCSAAGGMFMIIFSKGLNFVRRSGTFWMSTAVLLKLITGKPYKKFTPKLSPWTMKLLLLTLKLFSRQKFQREFELKEKAVQELHCGASCTARWNFIESTYNGKCPLLERFSANR